MTKEELIEFIQKLPDNAVINIDRAKFVVLDHVKSMGMREVQLAVADSTIRHDLTFSMVFETRDPYFPNKYLDPNSGFYKGLFHNR